MIEVINLMVGLLIYPGLAFSLAIGGVFYWLYRKVRARLQARIGPPWYQYFMDLIKLFSKESVIPYSSRGAAMVLAPIFSLTSLVLVAAMMPVGSESIFGFDEDLIVTLYLLAIPGLAMIIAGNVSGSPYGSVGSSREASIMVGYELPYVLSALTVGFHLRSLSISRIVSYQLESGAFFMKYPLATLAFLMCLLPKMGRRPFDAPEADTEIIGGPLTEYSGLLLGLFEVANGLKWFVIPAFTVNMFFGGAANPIEFLAKCLGVVLFLSVLDIIHPRYRIDQGFRFFFKWILPLALIDFVRSLIWP
ncbi:MAG: complex I subunit 1 family protein [Candidatus Bathyarchaeia archaeon]|nr:NADH-quinone oxidoreductase subunit H [Candidatus Bathyarchaeota archaeon]